MCVVGALLNCWTMTYLVPEVKFGNKFHHTTCHEAPEIEWRYSSTLSLTLTPDGGGWSTPRTDRFTPGKETRYPLYRRLDGPRGRSEPARKNSPLPGLDPQSAQLVGSRYTGYAIRPAIIWHGTSQLAIVVAFCILKGHYVPVILLFGAM